MVIASKKNVNKMLEKHAAIMDEWYEFTKASAIEDGLKFDPNADEAKMKTMAAVAFVGIMLRLNVEDRDPETAVHFMNSALKFADYKARVEQVGKAKPEDEKKTEKKTEAKAGFFAVGDLSEVENAIAAAEAKGSEMADVNGTRVPVDVLRAVLSHAEDIREELGLDGTPAKVLH